MLLMLRLLAHNNILFLKHASVMQTSVPEPLCSGASQLQQTFCRYNGQHRDQIVPRTPSFLT